MKEKFTEKQMLLWGQTNMVIGCVVITVIHLVTGLLGIPPIDWVWQGVLLVVFIPVGYLYYRQYQQTKKPRPEPSCLTDVDE